MTRTLTIQNEIGQLPVIHEFLQQIADDAKLSESISMNIKLAVEEAVVNVISYAYSGEKNKPIDISVRYEKGQMRITIVDSGIAFDPISNLEPDVTLPLEERPIGGLGTFLYKQLMTEVSYVRSGNKNVLTMIKDIN